MDDGADDTVRLRAPALPLGLPPARKPRRTWHFWTAGAVGLALAGFLFWHTVLSPPEIPPLAIPTPAPLASPALVPTGFPIASQADILRHRSSTLSVYRLASNNAVLVLDFPTLQEQSRMLNRVAVMMETRGQPHDRPLGNQALDAAIRTTGTEPETFYYGHDYRAADLVRFFNEADREGLALNAEETRLRELIGTAGWRDETAHGALISIPTLGVDRDDGQRATILRHEISHGEYFTNLAYAAYTEAFWRQILTEAERDGFRRFLAGESYDDTNEDLMRNEMQAYLVHTPDRRFFTPERAGLTVERADALRRQFLAGMPASSLR